MATLDPKAGEDLTQKIDQVEQSIASDLQRGNSPDPSTQAAMEDATLLKSQFPGIPVSPPPASPPPVIPPPPPPVSSSPLPPVGSVTPRKPRSKLTGFLFLFFGLAVLIGLAIATGLFSQIAPKLGLGSTTITYWGLWEPESVMRPVLDEFEKAHSGVKVEYKMESPQEYRERLQSAINSG